MPQDKAASMAALDTMLAEGGPPPAPPPDEGVPGTVTCGVCQSVVDSVTGEPLAPGGAAPAPAPLPAPGQGALPF